MSTEARIPGHRGRRPVGERLPLKFVHEYAPNGLRAPKYPVDVTGGITHWGMLGNGPDSTCTWKSNGVGNCTFAARQHYRMAKAARGHVTEKLETSNELVGEYLAYDHGVDEGAQISSLLQNWYDSGKILAFAPVDHTSPAAIDAAMAAFTGVYVGVCLTDDAEDLFANGQPWTVANGEKPNPNSGHCILKVYADGAGTDGWITWGAAQPSSTDWSAASVDEAWVIITKEDAESKLLDIAALRADIDALK